MALFLVTRKPVSATIPGMLPAFAWGLSNHARTSPWSSSQRLLLQVQLRLRITMQHIYSHAQNLRNECADHAGALGAYGLISDHNIHTALHSTSFLCLRHVTSSMTPCTCQAMRERHTRLHHNVLSEASDSFRAVSLCGFFFVSREFGGLTSPHPSVQMGKLRLVVHRAFPGCPRSRLARGSRR